MEDAEKIQNTDTDDISTPVEETPEANETPDLSDIDSLSEDEIMKLDINDVDGGIDTDQEENKQQTIDDKNVTDEKGDEDDKSKNDQEDQTTDIRDSGVDETNKTVDYEKRYKDLQASYTRSQQELKEYREKLSKKEKAELDSFEQLSDDEKAELKSDDPEAYADYIISEREHEQKVQQSQSSVESDRINAQRDEIFDFAKNQGVKLDDEKAVSDFFEGDKFKQVDEFVTNNFKPNKDGLYTKTQMNAAYRALFVDEIVQSKLESEKTSVTAQTLKEIERANKGGSDFDRLPPEIDIQGKRNISELEQEDIDMMSEEQVNKLLDEMPIDV